MLNIAANLDVLYDTFPVDGPKNYVSLPFLIHGMKAEVVHDGKAMRNTEKSLCGYHV